MAQYLSQRAPTRTTEDDDGDQAKRLAALRKGPAEWFGTVRVTYLTVNALRAVAFLEFGPAMAGRDD
jgi:hypothetical protein